MRSLGSTRPRRAPLVGALVFAWALVIAAGVGSGGSAARAQAESTGADFDLDNTGWNGLSELRALAREQDAELIVPSRLDIGTLTPADGLLIVHPLEAPPTEQLTAFLQAGGRVAVADDFGRADELFRAFRITRTAPSQVSAELLLLRGNRELIVARPSSSHPLVDGVDALVTNHPRVLVHRELEPVFALGDGEALVLTGAMGEGRFVALGDPSVLINNMLELAGNRQFASNLLLYLRRSASSRVFVVGPSVVIVGRFGDPGADRPLHDVRRFLERASSIELPPLAIRVLALTSTLLVLILVFGALPRRSPYEGANPLGEGRVEGGMLGRIEWYGARPNDLLEPALVYKYELERELRATLGLDASARIERAPSDPKEMPKEMLRAMRSRGLPPRTLEDAGRLLEELGSLAKGATREPPPVVGEAQLARLVTRGDALLAALDRGPDRGASEGAR